MNVTSARPASPNLPLSLESSQSESGASPLLQQPAASIGSGTDDAMAMLYAFISRQGSLEEMSGKNGVDLRKYMRDEALKKEQDALAREKQADGDGSKGLFDSVGSLVKAVFSDVTKLHVADAVGDAGSDVKAAWNSPNFWHDLEFGARVVAEVAAVVGSACMTAATFGSGAASTVIVVSLILSSAGAVESNTHVLEAVGVDAKVAGWVGVGLGVGGAAAGGIGSLMSSPAQVGKVAEAVETAGASMQAASGGASVVSGAAHLKTGAFEADSEGARADATSDEQRVQRLDRTIGVILDALKEATGSHERALETLRGAIQAKDDALASAAFGGEAGGAALRG